LLSLAEQLMLLLPERVAQPFSSTSLAQDLQVSVPTLLDWVKNFERLYLVFFIKPYAKKISHSLHKQQKMYLWDWAEVKNPGARFENLVAGHLLKACAYWSQLGLGKSELYYLRTREGQEVDFVLVIDQKPVLLIEAKLSDTQVSPTLLSYSKLLQIPGVQLIEKSGHYSQHGSCAIISADRWLGCLP
jgi:predicted AAA+ superfamily ATPase